MAPKPVGLPTDYRGRPVRDEIDLERDLMVRRGGTTDETGKFRAKRSGWDMLKNASIGFLQAAAANPNNPLAAGIGGAAAGGILTAASPTLGRELLFSATQQPALEAAQARQREEEMRARVGRMEDAKLRGLEADTEMTEVRAKSFPDQIASEKLVREKQLEAAEAARLRATRDPRSRNVIIDAGGFYRDRDTGEVMRDPATGQPIKAPTAPTRADRPESLADLEADRTAEEGSVEEIARDSTEARKDEIFASLPPKFREILSTGYYEEDVPAVDAAGNPVPGQTTRQRQTPSAEEVVAAQRAFNQAYDRIYRQNLDFTRGVAKRKTAERRTGGRGTPRATNQSIAPRNVNDLLQYLK